MTYTLNMGGWNSVFAVPTSLIDKHIKLAGKEQLQVMLWMLRHGGEEFDGETLSKELGMSEDAALDAIDYWKQQGLIASSGGELSPASQEIAAEKAESRKEDTKPLPKKRFIKPDTSYLAKRMKESDDIRNLLQEAEAVLGMLSPAMSSVLVASCDDYGLPVEVVVMIVNYAREMGKTSTAYIDSVARDWAESGIFTLSDAENKLQELSERRLAWSKVSSAAGLPKRSPSKREEEYAHRWVNEWKFTHDMISAAYERCVDNTGKFSAAYMNKIIERWHRDGVTNPDMIEAEENAKDGKKPSYDIDEMERLSFFDIPEDI